MNVTTFRPTGRKWCLSCGYAATIGHIGPDQVEYYSCDQTSCRMEATFEAEGYTQDGAQFYNSDGCFVFEATLRVRDYDMDAAVAARREFLRWLKSTRV